MTKDNKILMGYAGIKRRSNKSFETLITIIESSTGVSKKKIRKSVDAFILKECKGILLPGDLK
jgi:hypothetical protein